MPSVSGSSLQARGSMPVPLRPGLDMRQGPARLGALTAASSKSGAGLSSHHVKWMESTREQEQMAEKQKFELAMNQAAELIRRPGMEKQSSKSAISNRKPGTSSKVAETTKRNPLQRSESNWRVNPLR